MLMRFPDFLIIGAMKAGTTTLYRDLQTNPRVFLPEDKEPHSLCDDRVLTPEGREEYARLFRPARDDQVCGEASTGYTKLPDYPGVVERAAAVLPAHAKFMYIVRDPVKRLISHHHHAFTEGRCSGDIERAIEELPELMEYSRYATQVRPWVERFGRERVKVLAFERMVKDRVGVYAEVCEWLGVKPDLARLDVTAVHNASEGKPVLSDGWRAVQESAVYRRAIRPLLSPRMKDALRRALLPKAPPRPAPPGEALTERLRETFRGEMEELRRLADFPGVANLV